MEAVKHKQNVDVWAELGLQEQSLECDYTPMVGTPRIPVRDSPRDALAALGMGGAHEQ